MSREIKFRAWDKDNHKMLTGNDLAGRVVFLQTGLDTIGTSYEPLMQYTGLKDKNDKEIYEGDVCIVGDNGEYFPEEVNKKTDEFESSGKYIIEWVDESALFTVKPIDGTDLDLEFTPFGYAEFEVIGNIYENPELLS